ncbi:MAG: helix-turn-helix domain-containing protein [Lachnospiraceae bacterium]|nr:helix-turn-helix domain-containing protein [Lachnospiraceae bacterium]
MDDFQISLAAARVNAKLTQEDISREMNVSKNTVVNWENGKSEPTISQARRLAEYCGVPLDRIIFLQTKTN